METAIGVLQQNAPVMVILALGFWQVVRSLHRIDRRLVKVEVTLKERER